MKTRRGKLVGLGSAGLGVALLLVAGFSSRRLLLEQWHLSGLRSNDEESRKKAAQALGEYGSVRSITLLMKANSVLLQEKGRPDALVGMEKTFGRRLDQQGRRLDQQAKLARRLSETSPDASQAADVVFNLLYGGGLLRTRRQQTVMASQQAALDALVARWAAEVATMLTIGPYSLSLTRITEREKKAAVPYLSEELENYWIVRWLAVRLLGRLGSDAEDAMPVLETKTKDPQTTKGT